jgi:hypothetical protein
VTVAERGDESGARIESTRWRREEAALADALGTLLGRDAGAFDFAQAAEAKAVAEEFLASWRTLAGSGVVERTWPEIEIQPAVDTLHRISRNVGERPVWLIVGLSDPHAVTLASDTVLDNPLGFASLGDRELRLLDHDLPAGLCFIRHSHQRGAAETEYTWELSTWGEPWASATTRALRGLG